MSVKTEKFLNKLKEAGVTDEALLFVMNNNDILNLVARTIKEFYSFYCTKTIELSRNKISLTSAFTTFELEFLEICKSYNTKINPKDIIFAIRKLKIKGVHFSIMSLTKEINCKYQTFYGLLRRNPVIEDSLFKIIKEQKQ